MSSRTGLFLYAFMAVLLCGVFLVIPSAQAQQTLGGIKGTVFDANGGAIPATKVTAVGDQTKLTRTQQSNENGVYSFVNLPIGSYTLTFTQDGFQTLTIPMIAVQANRRVTLDATLKVGEITQQVTVEETPLLNQIDTTNGYVMDTLQIDAVPLPTGSFTGLALLAPGVNAELSAGTGAGITSSRFDWL